MTYPSTAPAPGVVRNMPDAEYRRAPGYGSTALKWFLKEVPAQAKYWIDHPDDAPKFDGAELGTLFHALVLEQPHGFIVKNWNLSTKAGKERAAEVLADHGGPVDAVNLSAAEFDEQFAAVGVTLIKSEDYRLAQAMREGAMRNLTLRKMLEEPGSAECSAFAEVDGVRVKARFDWLPEIGSRRVVALDLKSALSASPDKFTRAAAGLEYGVQRSGYLDVLKAVEDLDEEPELLFAVVDKRPPHLTVLIGLGAPWPEIGRERAAKARRIIRECEERERAGDPDAWPGYGNGVRYIDPPTWYVMQSEDEEQYA